MPTEPLLTRKSYKEQLEKQRKELREGGLESLYKGYQEQGEQDELRLSIYNDTITTLKYQSLKM